MSLTPGEWLTWWQLPLSGNTTHELPSGIFWHGRVMVLCWSVALPLGVIAARFYKVTPAQDWPNTLDNKRWWRMHLHGQSAAFVLSMIGIALVWSYSGRTDPLAQWHRIAGWLVTGLGALQGLSGLLRGSKGGPSESNLRGDHYDMTKRRNVFEWTHKSLGYVALVMGQATVCLGLLTADAPRWMLLAISAWWLLWASVFTGLQLRGRCMDTYQAIWGPGAHHPGNKAPANGWGVKRYTAAGFAREFQKTKEKR